MKCMKRNIYSIANKRTIHVTLFHLFFHFSLSTIQWSFVRHKKREWQECLTSANEVESLRSNSLSWNTSSFNHSVSSYISNISFPQFHVFREREGETSYFCKWMWQKLQVNLHVSTFLPLLCTCFVILFSSFTWEETSSPAQSASTRSRRRRE